ncbi:MAG: hypothetical protein ABIK09_16470 [Pseudomonadota bacterium]
MKAVFTSVIALLLASPVHATEFAPYAGEAVKITNADLPLKVEQYKDSAFYTEEYSFTIHPTKRPAFTIRIGATNMGRGKGTAFVHGTIVKAGKGRKAKMARYKIEEIASAGAWKQRAEPFSLEVGKVRLGGTAARFDLHIDTDEISADLEVRPLVPAWRPGTGRVEMAKGEGFEVIVWARAEVYGTLKMKSETKKVVTAVKGYAVVTRILNTASPGLQPRRWINFKSVKKDHTVLFQAFLPPESKGEALHGWTLVADNEKILAATHALEIKLADFREDHGTKIPWVVTWQGKGVRGGVMAEGLRSVVDELAKLPALERAVVGRFIQPMTWYLRAKYEVEAAGTKRSGNGNLIVNKIK